MRVLYTNVEGRSFDGLAEGCGVAARDVAGDYFRANRERVSQELARVFALSSPLRQVRGIIEAGLGPVVDQMWDASDELAAESDVVVGHFIAHPAGAAAAKHRRPYTVVTLAPLHPSAHYAPIGTPNLGRLLNPLMWKVLAIVIESILRLFPRCALIVHHGGAGTTQSAVLAGRPSIVVPHVADQFFWGDRLHALGVAPKPLKRTQLTAEALAGRIRAALADATLRPRAEQAALTLAAEDGATRAAELVESLARTGV